MALGDPEAVTAKLRDGVLTLTVPRATDPETSPRRVRIDRG